MYQNGSMYVGKWTQMYKLSGNSTYIASKRTNISLKFQAYRGKPETTRHQYTHTQAEIYTGKSCAHECFKYLGNSTLYHNKATRQTQTTVKSSNDIE